MLEAKVKPVQRDELVLEVSGEDLLLLFELAEQAGSGERLDEDTKFFANRLVRYIERMRGELIDATDRN
jgi:hypothetical protein